MGSVIGYPEAHGAAATFATDVAEKIKSLIVDVEPVQDLHGYDHPWPAGGGKNLLDDKKYQYTATQIRIGTDGSSDYNYIPRGIYTLSVTANVDTTVYYRIEGADAIRVGMNGGTFELEQDALVCFYCYKSGSLSVDDITQWQLELGSTATAYSPYSNICPITGWTGTNITHHGKNMAQYWQQAYIGADGSIKTGSTYAMSKPVFVQNGRPIAVSNTAGDYQGIAVFSDSSLENMIYRLANTASTYTASQDCYVVCWFNKVYSEYTESDFIDRGVQIEFAYSATAFEPYSHDEYDITFPNEAGIVYGGKVNAISGELIVNKTIVDLGTLEWGKANVGYFRSDSIKALIAAPVGQKTPADILCSKYPTLSYSQVNAMTITGIAVIGDTSANDIGRITINDLALSDLTAEDFKSSLSGTMLVYKMNTPITYSLTPKEIDTIIGTNTIYADTGDISVLYPKTLTPAETVSNVSLMELRRNIMMAMQHNYIPEIMAYGVEWNYNDPSTVLKRTGAASKFANPIPAESLNEVGWSPFDNVYPWSEMKRYNIINGEVAYSEDDAGYSETDYDTMVYIPEFYYYANKDTVNQKWNWSISAKPLEGYEKHPGSGRYVGRFHTVGSSSGVYSKGGVSVLKSLTRSNFRTYSQNKGTGWHQFDFATLSAIQLLYLIEFADWNSQSVLGTGATSRAKNTGLTSNASYHTIKQSDASNIYRWIENLYSNAYTWVDGFVESSYKAYVTSNINNYTDSPSNMTNTNITLAATNWIIGFGYSSTYPWAFIPDSSSADNASNYVCDKINRPSSSTRVLCFGGSASNNTDHGMFFMGVDNDINTAVSWIGSRLIFIPSN